MRRPSWSVLVCAAHGTRDPDGRAVVEDVAAAVRARRPGLAVALGYVDEDVQSPGLAQVLRELAPGPVAVVPLLLSRGGHVLSDLPGALAAAPATQACAAGPLGPHPALVAQLDLRLQEAGAEPGDAVVVAASGTRDPDGQQDVRDVARALAERRGLPAEHVAVAFAAAAGPRVGEAVAELRRHGAPRVAVATYALAPGVLPSRLLVGALEADADAVAAPLGACDAVVDAVLDRLDRLDGLTPPPSSA